MNNKYYKAGTTIIRAKKLSKVQVYFPHAKQISREKAAKHDAKGGAIQCII